MCDGNDCAQSSPLLSLGVLEEVLLSVMCDGDYGSDWGLWVV